MALGVGGWYGRRDASDGARVVISAVVIAAGAATRFGSTKQLRRVRDKPLVQHAVDAASSVVDEVVVVLGHDADAVEAALTLPPNGRALRNPRFAEGQSTSLAAGLRACTSSSEAAVVLLADQPGIADRHIRTLVEAFRATGAPILRIRFRDGPGPALLARPVWPEAERLTGDVGARALFDAEPERVRWVSVDEDAPPDVDLPEDLDRA
ncbi:MAG TPA: nucleotidyltransferase family protein [Actinomycetota bacterium]|nr:nucleotidyltransferase family protein [Actinomycetota bacterium]